MDNPQSKDDVAAIAEAASPAGGGAKAKEVASAPPAPPAPSAPRDSPSSPEDNAAKKTSSGTNSDSSTRGEDDASVSSDVTDVAIAKEDFLDEDINAAPMHLHALSRIPDARLRGKAPLPRHNSEGKLSIASSADGGSSRRSGGRGTSLSASGRRSANSSRSSSPLPSQSGRYDGGGEAGSRTRGDASSHSASAPGGAHSVHSGHSSLDGIFDPDVLLDRLGFIDLDPPLPHEIRFGPLAAPGTVDGKSNNSGGLTPVNERLSEETLEDCHAFNDLVMIDNLKHVGGGTTSHSLCPSVAHSSLSGMRSDMSVGSLSVGSFKGGHSRGGSVAGGSLMGDGENSVLLGTLDEEGEDELVDEVEG